MTRIALLLAALAIPCHAQEEGETLCVGYTGMTIPLLAEPRADAPRAGRIAAGDDVHFGLEDRHWRQVTTTGPGGESGGWLKPGGLPEQDCRDWR